MATIVLRDPQITMTDLDTDGQGTKGSPVDLSCHIVTVTIDHDEDEVDVSTWCRPGATEIGPPAYSVTIDWKIQTDTDATVKPLLGQEVEVSMKANSGDTSHLGFTMNFGQVNPAVIGTWTAGEAVESSTAHGVTTDPAWATA